MPARLCSCRPSPARRLGPTSGGRRRDCHGTDGQPIGLRDLINNVFSLAGQQDPLERDMRDDDQNFSGGWFVGTVPIMTANWMAGGEKWTLPVGLQGRRLIKIADKLPVNILVGA